MFEVVFWLIVLICFFFYIYNKKIKKNNVFILKDTNTVESFYVAGTFKYKDNIKSLLKKSNPNYSDFVYRVKEDFVIFYLEPQNEHDKNAIAVYMNNVKIGYVPANLTQKIKPLISTHRFVGKIFSGDVRNGDSIQERDFKCEVNIINEN